MDINNKGALSLLKGRKVSIVGYGTQGKAQASCLRDSGIDIVLGLRREGKSWEKAKNDGFDVREINDAVSMSDFIQVLIPDEYHQYVYEKNIEKNLSKGKVLCFSHGFSIVYKQIIPPSYVDVIMVAPKAPGDEQRKCYEAGFGVPALIAVHQDYTGLAWDLAMSYAEANRFTLAGVIKTDFESETFSDLFGEQVVLCGGCSELIKSAYGFLVSKGYPPELAYFESLHELKLIVDLIHFGGIEHMWEVVSNTAEYGGRTRGNLIINESSKQNMAKILEDIENGSFANEYLNASKNNHIPLRLARNKNRTQSSDIESVGERIRKMFRKVSVSRT